MTTVPGPTPGDVLDTRFAWAKAYIGIGWPVFILGHNKQPVALCDKCQPRVAGPGHDRERCECLLCHGFYAATLDLTRVAQMLVLHPDGQMAVRTGAASNLIALDFEVTSDGSDLEVTGLDVLEQWEAWVGGWSLPPTLTARTESGGVHLLYAYRSVGQRVRQKIRPLPAMDVKADGGYVAVPSGIGNRHWVGDLDVARVADVTPELSHWLVERPTAGRWSGNLGRWGRVTEPGVMMSGYDYELYLETGPPVGLRDHFFNDAIFRMRRAGIDRDEVENRLRGPWEACDQGDVFPWDWVLYKIDRVFATIEPQRLSLSALQRAWLHTRDTPVVGETEVAPSITRHGRVTIVQKERRMGL